MSRIKRQKIKRGRSTAILYTAESGEQCFIANRKIADIIKADERTISDAIRSGKAAWAIEDDWILQMRAKGVRFIGIVVRETKEIFLTGIDRYLDREKFKMTTLRGGGAQRALPWVEFQRRAHKIRV